MKKLAGIRVKNHWSKTVLLVTIVLTIGLIATVYFLETAADEWWMSIFSALLLLTIVGTAAFCPVYLTTDRNVLVQKKVVGEIRIPFTDIRRLEKLDDDGIGIATIRTFGSGGYFGYLGHFRNKKLGKFNMYITEIRNLILVTTDKKKYVFNCNDREFFELLEKAVRGDQ